MTLSSENLADVIKATAAWLVDAGYPFDVRLGPPPPEHLRRFVEDEWIRRDAISDQDALDVRWNVAQEGGWLESESIEPDDDSKHSASAATDQQSGDSA